MWVDQSTGGPPKLRIYGVRLPSSPGVFQAPGKGAYYWPNVDLIWFGEEEKRKKEETKVVVL